MAGSPTPGLVICSHSALGHCVLAGFGSILTYPGNTSEPGQILPEMKTTRPLARSPRPARRFEFRALLLVVGLWALGPQGSAQTSTEVTIPRAEAVLAIPPTATIHREITRLVRQRAGMFVVPPAPDLKTESLEIRDDLLVLDPVIVREKRTSSLSRPPETAAEEFYRTGTILEHVGRKVTTRFWFSSGKGIMLSFDF